VMEASARRGMLIVKICSQRVRDYSRTQRSVSLSEPSSMTEAATNMRLPATVPPEKGQLLSTLPRIARNLDEPAGWLSELASLYRSARRGQLDTQDASRLAYLCAVAGKLARDVEQLRQVKDMMAILQQPQQGQPTLDYSDAQPIEAQR